MQRSNSTDNLVNYKNRVKFAPSRHDDHHHQNGANSVKLEVSETLVLTIALKDRTEKYTIVTEGPKPIITDPKTGLKAPMTPGRLVRFFRKNCIGWPFLSCRTVVTTLLLTTNAFDAMRRMKQP